MKKFKRNSTAWTLFIIRKRYQEKRHCKKWKNRKKNKKVQKKRLTLAITKHKRAQYIDHEAPKNFSFINNTNEVLNYFQKAKKILHSKNNINFDISEVENMTPDTIALLVASIRSQEFMTTGNSKGNAPKKADLKKLFIESGFNEHVTNAGFKKRKTSGLLHKEVDKKVVPKIAKNACITGLNHVFNKSEPFPPLYEILIECMSNTHNHADLQKQGECRWWLYVHNNPKTKISSYSFVDLGVGIFKSAYTKGHIKILKNTPLLPNIKLVDDLLEGKIQSRIDKDRRLRGKGIPQIVKHSKEKCFKTFYIITNDVKINLINGEKEALTNNFKGTFLYWELSN